MQKAEGLDENLLMDVAQDKLAHIVNEQTAVPGCREPIQSPEHDHEEYLEEMELIGTGNLEILEKKRGTGKSIGQKALNQYA